MANVEFSDYLADAEGNLKPLTGSAAASGVAQTVPAMLGDRPSMRKLDGGLLCTVPIADGGWLARFYDPVPSNVMATDLLRSVQLAAQDRKNTAKPAAPSISVRLADDALGVLKKNRISYLLNSSIEHGLMSAGIAVLIRNGKIKKSWYSNIAHVNSKDEIAVLLKECQQQQDKTSFQFAAGDHTETGLNGGLLAERLGGKSMSVTLHGERTSGYALIAVDPRPTQNENVLELPSLFRMLVPPRGMGSKIVSQGRRLVWIGLAALAVVGLLMPADVNVSNQARAIPASVVIASLPIGAFVENVSAIPGTRVQQNDIVAVLKSPELQNAKAQQELNQNLEAINASAALDEGDYGAFQLAEKRREIAELQLSNIEDRISQLVVRAPADGTVVQIIAASEVGVFLQAGTPIMSLQDDAKFDVLIETDPTDAPLIEPGQTGRIHFKGLGNDNFGITVTQPPQRVIDPDTGAQLLELRASVTAGDQDKLLVGLTGYAKIAVDRAPFIVGATRPVVEYVRLKLWTFLGWEV